DERVHPQLELAHLLLVGLLLLRRPAQSVQQKIRLQAIDISVELANQAHFADVVVDQRVYAVEGDLRGVDTCQPDAAKQEQIDEHAQQEFRAQANPHTCYPAETRTIVVTLERSKGRRYPGPACHPSRLAWSASCRTRTQHTEVDGDA